MVKALVKILCVLCCFAIAGSVLLPYLTLNEEEMAILHVNTNVYRLMDGSTPGGVVLIVAGAGLVVSLLGWYFLSLIAGLAAIGLSVYINIAIARAIPNFMAHYGLAYYLLLFGGIILVIASVIGWMVKAAAKKENSICGMSMN